MKPPMRLITSGLHLAFTASLLAGVLLAPTPGAKAAPISSKQAAAVVAGWLSVSQSPLGESLGSAVKDVETFTNAAGDPMYYIAYLEPAGFVIVAADDLVEPIIGFASSGRFDPSPANPLGALVSGDLAARIAYVRQSGSVGTDTNAVQAQAKWQQLCPPNGGPVIVPKGVVSISDVRVAPLTQTTWSQKTAADAGTAACYNYYTPPNGDGNTANYPAGCVATAMAQLMRYYRFPTTPVGTASFTIYINGVPTTAFLRGSDNAGGAYVWNDMPLVPSGNPPTAQCRAIGALLADAGATVGMHYTSADSSSSPYDGRLALVSTFQFASARYAMNGGGNLGSALVTMINPNLDARFPTILSIARTGGGHAVVADGYGYNLSTLYHHLNLGWSGNATAWYALPMIDAGTYTYNVVDGCIYNAYTNATGEIISGRVLDQISRPVSNATVTAMRTGGGTYVTTTDSNGIYALAGIPSASSYSITVAKANYSSATNGFSTGTSMDLTATSGNYWGADFTLNLLPTVVDHLVWGAVAPTQNVNAAFSASITAQNATNGVVGTFTGPVALNGYMTGLAPGGTLIGNLDWTQARSSASGLTHGYSFTPNTNLQVTAVRSFSGDKVCIWTDSGTLLASQGISSSGSWAEVPLTTPVLLSAGTTYRVTGHYGANVWGYYTTPWPTSFAKGSIGQTFYTTFGDAFPVQVFTNSQGPLVDLRYQVAYSNAIAISPTSSGAFVNGVWTGNITVSQVSTNVMLRADDGAGHVATSTPFSVVDPSAIPPQITEQPKSTTNNIGDTVTFTVTATGGQSLYYSWRRNGSAISGANTSSYTTNNVQLADSGSQFTCVVTNNYGARTSDVAVLTVISTNITVAAQPAVTLSAGAEVYAMALQSDGSLIFGGYFTSVNNTPRNGLARLLPDGSLDTAWNPAPNSSTFAIAVSGTNVYIGGAFTSVGPYLRGYIARVSPTGTGAVDPTWNPNASDWVQTIVPSGTDVYVGGYFTGIGLQTRSCIAKLSSGGTGLADATWNPNATFSGDLPSVQSIVLDGTSVYAGGYFMSIGGQTRYCVARLSSSGIGAADATWDPSAYGTVLTVLPNGNDVYVGGAFTYIGGRTRNHIAKVSSAGTGTVDVNWDPSANDEVDSLAIYGRCLYVGGFFTSIGGFGRANLAKLKTSGNGAADSAWQADCNDGVYSLLSTSSALYLGGKFTQVATVPRAGVVALAYKQPRLVSPQRPGAGPFQSTLTSERDQAFEILGSSNLVNWDTVTTLTNSTGTTNFTDAAPGLNRRFYRARQLP